jgi:MOSC domain-containing protein YiiM
MIDIDLPHGPGSPLVRGVAACLSSVTEVPLTDLPQPPDDASLPHALASWKSWLAGRGSGLVPIADPRTFQWAGWWIAVVDQSPAPDGPRQQVAAVALGTPPGIVLSPQDPDLLGRPTADLPISSAYAVASLDPVVAPLPRPTPLTGTVEQIAVAADATAPMQLLASARALTGRGLEGDRYARGAGTFSSRGDRRPGYDLTLIAAEDVEELTAQHPHLDFASTRRNILTRGIDVNALVGREFTVGDVRCHGLRLAEPCAHLEQIAGPGLLRPLIHRGGLRADVLDDGVITTGDTITA